MTRDLEEDIKNDAIIMAKLQNDSYAQNVYSAMCNMQWQPQEIWPILKDEYWSISWRGAGDVVADLRGCGEDYIDWYCSGIGGEYDKTNLLTQKGYVPEGVVTDEIREDFARIGWRPVAYPKRQI
jgi:hypothetical protein